MPDRVYEPRKTPPSKLDRLRAHPEAATIAVASLVAGLLMVFSALTPDYVPSKSMDLLDFRSSLIVGLLLNIGGGVRLYAMTRRFDTMNGYWAIHRAAATLEAAGWGTYTLIWLNVYPTQQIVALMGLALTFTCVWNLGESILEEKYLRGRK